MENRRDDIDGLRAVAVLLVVFHHLGAPLTGGYIGVDVFFVISGFLITGQIAETARAGTFKFTEFYKRRINRIVPALLAVVVACLAVGLVVISPADFKRLAISAGAALVGFSNVFFWREYGNYFAADAAEAPLLHTWSLGVEEQFYFLWPAVVLLLVKLPRRWLGPVLAALLIGGVALSQFGLGVAATASYYLLPTRFFELLLGAALALTPLGQRRLPQAAGWVGLALILGSAVLLTPQSRFPGVNALAPCVGAALLLLSRGVAPLRTRAAVFIGLISYSLYLWHWPLIALANYRGVGITVPVGAGLFVASVVLTWASWKYIEMPARRANGTWPFARVFVRRFAVPVGLVAGFAAVAATTQGFPARFDPRVAAIEHSTLVRPEKLREGCHVPTALYATPPDPEKCRLGARDKAPQAILLGDSFANHFTGMVDVIAAAEGLSVMDYTMDACPPIVGFDTGKPGGYAAKCLTRNEAALHYLQEHHFAYVILAGTWPEDEAVGEKIAQTVEAIQRTGAKVVIVQRNQPIPGAGGCAVRALMRGESVGCAAPQSPPPGYMGKIQQQFPEVRFIDPNVVMCPGGVCQSFLQDTLLYRDGGHLNDIGSRLVGRLLLQRGVTLE